MQKQVFERLVLGDNYPDIEGVSDTRVLNLIPSITCRKLKKPGAKLQGCNFEYRKPGRLIGTIRKSIAELTAILVA